MYFNTVLFKFYFAVSKGMWEYCYCAIILKLGTLNYFKIFQKQSCHWLSLIEAYIPEHFEKYQQLYNIFEKPWTILVVNSRTLSSFWKHKILKSFPNFRWTIWLNTDEIKIPVMYCNDTFLINLVFLPIRKIWVC